ncbi:hypothetical protein DW322_10880 [Rhodococcus rhodnii]|uniref:Uncharacterized protein n=2 Tax=Rhodococcus rhodnii TaxID=38312 RepID=R7WQ24_9NOCA|nr:hypothetical protein [Rhodococcus rhodnii]EOM77422.1 hypothetical protein Rrhod_1228 [Rhodococcus rhodnii LMG 5362]TXG90624.1 hypothetical protein DW322_10880 [Rhodococcus rhodnii]
MFVDAEDDPSLTAQWAAEHSGGELADRRCREVLVDTTGHSAQSLAERVLDVICPHARTEDATVPPMTTTPDEFPWSAHTPLWDSGTSHET